MRDQRMTFLSAALLTTLVALPGGALAQDNSKIVPANAQAKQYGSGWECKPGFRRDGAACAAVKLPANAYLSDDTFGPGWACMVPTTKPLDAHWLPQGASGLWCAPQEVK